MASETHLSLRALLDGTVRVEGDDLPVSDAWIDPDAMALRYVGIDVGGWLDRHTALVSAGRLRWSDGWRADVTREEIEGQDARLEEGGGPVDIRGLPPVVTGPFGYTISPLLIGAGLMAGSEDEMPPRPPGDAEAADAPRDRARALDRAGDWLGTAVTARGGVGDMSVSDLLIEPSERRITHLVIEAAGHPRAVPAERLGYRATPDAPLTLELTRAEIEAAPEMVSPREAARRDAP